MKINNKTMQLLSPFIYYTPFSYARLSWGIVAVLAKQIINYGHDYWSHDLKIINCKNWVFILFLILVISEDNKL